MTEKVMMDEPQEDEIDLMDLFRVIWRRRWLIIGVVILSMAAALLFAVYQDKEIRTEKAVSLAFDGIGKGEYPDGSSFNKMDLVSPTLLNKLDADVDLSGHFVVEEVLPDNIKAKMKKNPDFVYHPNRFKIVITEQAGEELFKDSKERGKVMEAIPELFREKFEKKYIQEAVRMARFSDDFLRKNEYDDIVYILNEQITIVESFLTDKIETAKSFRSKENGYSFPDLLSELSVLKTIDLDNIYSAIKTYNLAKDTRGLIARFKDDIKKLGYQRGKHEKMAEKTFEMIKTVLSRAGAGSDSDAAVAGQSSTQFMVDTSILDTIKEDNYLFHLIKLNIENTTRAVEADVEISRLKDRVAGLKDSRSKRVISDEDIVNQLTYVKNQIVEYAKKARDLNHEYLVLKYGNTIHAENLVRHTINYQVKPRRLLALTFAASIFFGLFLAFFVDYISRNR